MEDTLRDFELEDLRAFRRLRLDCPVYGNAYLLLKNNAAGAYTPSRPLRAVNWGYYNHETNAFQLTPTD